MAKRRDDSDSLPLFDLPLREDPPDEEPPPDVRSGGGPTSLGGSPRAPSTATRREAFEVDPEPGELATEVARGTDTEVRQEQQAAALASRLTSGIVDLLAQLAALAVAAAATLALQVPIDRGDFEPFALLGLAFSFLYWVVPLAFWGQTPGMSLRGLLARTLEDEPLTFEQTARRWLGALLTAGLAGLPLLVALSGRSLTDRISGTKTISLARD